MVRIMGNTTERVPIKDLNDVIYYRQIKQYSDAEYDMSKDLKREKIKGSIVVLEQNDGLRGSEMDLLRERVVSSTINAKDLKDAIREVLGPVPDVKGAIRDIAPLIIDVVRQEISKITINASNTSVAIGNTPAKFEGPGYVPTVSTEGMISNIEAKKSEVSSNTAQDALAALRRLNNKNQ